MKDKIQIQPQKTLWRHHSRNSIQIVVENELKDKGISRLKLMPDDHIIIHSALLLNKTKGYSAWPPITIQTTTTHVITTVLNPFKCSPFSKCCTLVCDTLHCRGAINLYIPDCYSGWWDCACVIVLAASGRGQLMSVTLQPLLHLIGAECQLHWSAGETDWSLIGTRLASPE